MADTLANENLHVVALHIYIEDGHHRVFLVALRILFPFNSSPGSTYASFLTNVSKYHLFKIS